VICTSRSDISAAYCRVKATKGAAGVDEVSIEEFEADLGKNGVYRIVQCHSRLHVRQWRAKDSRPLLQPCRQKLSLRSTLWRLSRCHQTKLSRVPVRVGALTDDISNTPSVSSRT
jgi:hypothetical protein